MKLLTVRMASWVLFVISNLPSAEKHLFDIPTLRDYFIDLEKILAVISDGPTKSFAFRRLKYLASKWSMYSLLHEQEEIAAMKVCPSCLDEM